MREILVMLAAAAVFLASVAAQAAGLVRGEIEVTENRIAVGDLFYGVGAGRATQVARAPEPGETRTFDRAWLVKIAQRHNIDWQPTGDAQATVVRAVREISAKQIRARLRDALAAQSPGDKVRVTLYNGNARLLVPEDAGSGLRVAELDKRSYSERFDATLVAPAQGEPVARLTVSGRAAPLVELPVLARDVERGDVIDKGELTTITRQAERVYGSAIRDAERLVGKAATRSLRARQPLQARDVRKPRLVKEGDKVTLIVRRGSLQLTAQGTALAGAAKGQQVQVRNTSSNNRVTGTVNARGHVVVRAGLDRAGS